MDATYFIQQLCFSMTQNAQIIKVAYEILYFINTNTNIKFLNIIYTNCYDLLQYLPNQCSMKILELMVISLAIFSINSAFIYLKDQDDLLLPTSFYKCVKSQGSNGIINSLSSTGFQGQNEDQITNIYNAKNAGLQVQVMFVPCASLNVQKEVQSLLQLFGTRTIKRFWVFPYYLPKQWSPQCGIEIMSPEEKCSHFKKLLQVFKINQLDAQVFTFGPNYWEATFGQRDACQELGSKLLFLRPQSTIDDKPNFDNYVKFGGWDKPYMKVLSSPKTVCGVELLVNYYEDG